MRWVPLTVALVTAGCGGRVEQSPPCQAFAGCIRAMDAAAGQTTNLDRFDAAGACWVNSDTSLMCTTGCERGLARLRERTLGLPAECAS